MTFLVYAYGIVAQQTATGKRFLTRNVKKARNKSACFMQLSSGVTKIVTLYHLTEIYILGYLQ